MILGAVTGPFAKGLRRAGRQTERFSRRVSRTLTRVTAFGGAAVAAATGGGLAVLVRQQFKAIDSTAKFADRLGLATDKLVGLEYAASLTGVRSNQLQMGLQRMTRRIAEAAKGTGEAQGAIKQLGLDAAALARMSPDEQFRAIAARMKDVETQGERVRLAFKLFDSEGVALVNTLRMGSDGLERAQREAERLGLTFSRIDAAKIEEANDSFARAKLLVTALGRAIAITVAPLIDSLSDGIVGLGQDVGDLESLVQNAIRKILRAAGFVIDKFKQAQLAFTNFLVFGGKAIQILNEFNDPLDLTGIQDVTRLQISELERAAQELQKQITEGAGNRLVERFNESINDFERSIIAARGLQTFLDKLRDHPFFRSGGLILGGNRNDPLGLIPGTSKFIERMKMAGEVFMDRVRESLDFARDFQDRLRGQRGNAAVERGSVAAYQARQEDRYQRDTAANTGQLVSIARAQLERLVNGSNAAPITVVDF